MGYQSKIIVGELSGYADKLKDIAGSEFQSEGMKSKDTTSTITANRTSHTAYDKEQGVLLRSGNLFTKGSENTISVEKAIVEDDIKQGSK